MILHLMGDGFITQAKTFTPLAHKLASVVGEIFHWSVKLSTIPANLAKSCSFNSWTNFVSSVDESIKICKFYMEKKREIILDYSSIMEGVFKSLVNIKRKTSVGSTYTYFPYC